MPGFLKELGVASKQAGENWPEDFGNACAGQGRLQEAAAGAERSRIWVSGAGELLLNPPQSDVPRAGVLLQK